MAAADEQRRETSSLRATAHPVRLQILSLLTGAFYGEYSGYPTTNVYIGAPRSFEVALATRF